MVDTTFAPMCRTIPPFQAVHAFAAPVVWWSARRADGRDVRMCHMLRREAEATIL